MGIILVIALAGFTLHQQSTLVQEEKQEIIGTWHIEENPPSYKWVFYENGLLEDYSENQIFETYTWQITEGTTPSGLTISHLILTNVDNENEIYHYEINGLSNDTLALVYQRPGGGLGKLTTYIKQ